MYSDIHSIEKRIDYTNFQIIIFQNVTFGHIFEKVFRLSPLVTIMF